jgi:hypothetical protein
LGGLVLARLTRLAVLVVLKIRFFLQNRVIIRLRAIIVLGIITFHTQGSQTAAALSWGLARVVVILARGRGQTSGLTETRRWDTLCAIVVRITASPVSHTGWCRAEVIAAFLGGGGTTRELRQ